MSDTTSTLVSHEIADIAHIVHEATRVIQKFNDEEISPVWENAPDWMKESTISGIRGVLSGNGPEQSHEQWMAERLADGWTLGPVKSVADKVSPCLVPYAELPPLQRLKDDMFVHLTAVLSGW